MKRIDITTNGWNDYELIDCGEGRKLERFGTIITDRPDPQALWEKTTPSRWNDAGAQFLWKDKGERWTKAKETPETWQITWKNLSLELSLKGFKHLGIFPEHASQWEEMTKVAGPGMHVLNLFGYTGAASLAAAAAGAKVTHVDASKTTIGTLKENMQASGLPADAIRTVCEDAFRYAKRLVQRGETFDIIVMDPPAFGRGPKGEVWKIEEKFAELMALLPDLLSPEATLVIVNGYAAGYAARSFGEVLAQSLRLRKGTVTYGDVGIAQGGSGRILPTGIYASWKRMI